MTTMTADAPVDLRLATARRGGWLLIAAFLSFVAALAYLIVAGAEYNAELTAAAEAAGTTIATVPVDEQARIAVRHASVYVVSGVLLLVPFAVFPAALQSVRGALRATDGAGLARAAWWLGLGTLVVWCFLNLLTYGLLAGPGRLPPLVRDLDRLFAPLTSAASALGLAAVTCAGLAARRAGVARRAALGAVVVAGVLLVLGVAVTIASGAALDLPPIAPMLAALILGVGLARVRSA